MLFFDLHACIKICMHHPYINTQETKSLCSAKFIYHTPISLSLLITTDTKDETTPETRRLTYVPFQVL